jgi:hypothetical protein
MRAPIFREPVEASRAGGVEADVDFERPAPEVQTAIDDAYHAKYDRCGPRIVDTVVGPAAADVTIRLTPHQPEQR